MLQLRLLLVLLEILLLLSEMMGDKISSIAADGVVNSLRRNVGEQRLSVTATAAAAINAAN